MFSVHPHRLKTEGEDMLRQVRELDLIIRSVDSVMDALPNFLNTDANEEINRALHKLSERLQCEEQDLKCLSDNLIKISDYYNESEKNILKEAQEVSVIHHDVSAVHNNITWFAEKLSGIKFE